jgi:hypothetical protein
VDIPVESTGGIQFFLQLFGELSLSELTEEFLLHGMFLVKNHIFLLVFL